MTTRDVHDDVGESDDEIPCGICGTLTTVENFCHGCGAAICERCDNTLAPVGAHSPDEHHDGDTDEDDDA